MDEGGYAVTYFHPEVGICRALQSRGTTDPDRLESDLLDEVDTRSVVTDFVVRTGQRSGSAPWRVSGGVRASSAEVPFPRPLLYLSVPPAETSQTARAVDDHCVEEGADERNH